jgi:phage shock protein A
VEKLQQRNVTLANELRTIETQRDMAALGTTVEREQWARVRRVETALAAAPDTPENADLRVRLALVKGVLQFRLNDAFNARLWQEHRALKDLSLALHEAQSRWIRVERDRKSVPTNTGEFADRVTALKQRIDSLQARLAATGQKQSVFLARLAAHELEEQKDRLAAYQVQARFALASMYDRAANADITHAPVPGGNQAAPATPPPEEAPAPPEAPPPPEEAPVPRAAEPPR